MRAAIPLVAVLAGALALMSAQPDDSARTYLERSVPYLGAGIPAGNGGDGAGIRVAVIDTGVDYGHPDLLGWGPGGKIVGGYNFVSEGLPPIDTNGHGTQVAGIIAADGQARGVAPGAEILAYKVSEDGEGVSSDLITRAVMMAVDDGADIINISLGVNRTNSKIEGAVRYALDRGVFVVVAAGNDGPGPGTIGSPGRSYGAVTVGATYNNLTSSLVATLKVDAVQYATVPMVGSSRLDAPIDGKIVFGGYGRPGEIEEAEGAILVVERGSDVEEEMLYFSIKEQNAAAAGARALVVYNNVPGIFLGELIHEFSGEGYEPQIPVVSMERKDGMELAASAGRQGTMHLFYNPDFAAYFSSRGPVSPFYIKPDIMAPGAYINTTHSGSTYNFTSGTSYAAPHVAGAAALLLQKNPELTIEELRSILLTTAQPVSDAYGKRFPVHAAGSGRLDIGAAYGADLIVSPPNFVAATSAQKDTAGIRLDLRPISGKLGEIGASIDAPGLEIRHKIEEGAVHIDITGKEYGMHEGMVRITHNQKQYVVPFVAHHTPGSVAVEQAGSELAFDIQHEKEWSFAKISVTGSAERTLAAIPGERPQIQIYENGEYWVEARIQTDNGTSGAFDSIIVDSLSPDLQAPPLEIEPRPILILAGIAALAAIAGALRRARR